MQARRNYSFTKRIFGLGLASLLSLSHAAPLIVLPEGEITRFSYAGQEFFDDKNGNRLPDRGDVFKGVVNITRIQGAASGADFSSQLTDKELTGRFHFSIIDQSSDFSHLEFGLLPGDFFNFYVGQGSTKNFDPSASNAYDRASDGQFWLGLQPGGFFESVNDRQSNGSTLNRAWADITVNNTGYSLHSDLLRTILGKDAQHIAGSQSHGDHSTQLIFDNQVAGPASFPSQFTFDIFGEFDVFAVPEPPTWLLILLGMTIGLNFSLLTARPRTSIRRDPVAKLGMGADEAAARRFGIVPFVYPVAIDEQTHMHLLYFLPFRWLDSQRSRPHYRFSTTVRLSQFTADHHLNSAT